MFSRLREPVHGCPSWLLALFDTARRNTSIPKDSKTPPPAMRLMIGTMLHVDPADRDGEYHHRSFDTVHVLRWLFPDGGANERRDWHKFPEALNALDGLRVRDEVKLVTSLVIPVHRGASRVE